jgi:hypothetical protein
MIQSFKGGGPPRWARTPGFSGKLDGLINSMARELERADEARKERR